MKKNSIKAKLLWLLFVSISCAFAVLGIYSISSEYSAKYDLIKQKELDLSKQTSKFINSYLESKLLIVQAVAQALPKSNLNINNQEIINKLLLGKESGKFSNFYLGLKENGNLLKYNSKMLNIEKNNYDARTRPWYKKAIEINKTGITKPYIDVATNKLVITVFAPFKNNGNIIGVVGSDIFLDTVVNTILNVKLEGSGFAYLLNKDGTTLIHKNKRLLNTPNKLFAQVKSSQNTDFGEADQNGVIKLIAYSKIPISSWYFAVELDKNSIFEDINNQVIFQVLLYIALLIIILLIIYFRLVKILMPLKTLEQGLFSFFKYLKGEENNIVKLNIHTGDEFANMAAMIDKEIEIVSTQLSQDKLLIEKVKEVVTRVKDGKFDLNIEQNTNNPSLQELKIILNDMITTTSNNVDKDISLILESIDQYSKLNFTKDIKYPTGKVSTGLNKLCSIINKMLQENKVLGTDLSNNAQVLLKNVDLLNDASNKTAISLNETSTSLSDITTAIKVTTENIVLMSSYNENLIESIKLGQELANTTVSSMNDINIQTQAIADAIVVIDQIAFQTNILSLNAAVEAATAGEAGKGFAVVAQEVRNLASRSADAAMEIKDLVKNATSTTNLGKQSADKMIYGYENLNANIQKVTSVIHDIEIAAKEQKVGIEQINDVVTSIDTQTQHNAKIATQTKDVATITSNIAQIILDDVNEKEFIGKDNVKAKNI